jgi:ADP-glucose pyrophosphorylase
MNQTTVAPCGDAIVDLDIQQTARRHRTQGAIASVVTLEVDQQMVANCGVVVSDANGRVAPFQENRLRAGRRERQRPGNDRLAELRRNAGRSSASRGRGVA